MMYPNGHHPHDRLFDQRSAKAFGLSVDELDHAWARAELSTYVGVTRPHARQLFMVMRAPNRPTRKRRSKEQEAAYRRMVEANQTGKIAAIEDVITATPRYTYPEPNAYPARKIGRPQPHRLLPIVNKEHAYANKPEHGSGLWTSTYLGPKYLSDWVEWCQGAEFPYAGEYRSWIMQPDPDAFVLRISGAHSCDSLTELGFMYVPEWARKYGNDSILTRPQLDFEKLAHVGVDGIHLTEKGNHELHLHMRHDFNAWDSESTLWLRWAFVSVRVGPKVRIPVGWRSKP